MGGSIIMDIFQIKDLANSQVIYYVPDMETQSLGMALGISNTEWNIGIFADAQNQLAINQEAFLTQEADRFHANIETLNEDGHPVWEHCDLSIEVPNTTTTYQLYDVEGNNYTSAIGLDEANALMIQMKQKFLTSCKMDAVITLTELPVPRKLKVNPIIT